MSNDHTLTNALHEATHLVPGVPEHRDLPSGHQGAAAQPHARAHRSGAASSGQRTNAGAGAHQGAASAHQRAPRVLVGWQNWIAGVFSRGEGR